MDNAAIVNFSNRSARAAISGSCVTMITVCRESRSWRKIAHHLFAGMTIQRAGRLIIESPVAVHQRAGSLRTLLLLSAVMKVGNRRDHPSRRSNSLARARRVLRSMRRRRRGFQHFALP